MCIRDRVSASRTVISTEGRSWSVSLTKLEPMNPAPPVTRTFITALFPELDMNPLVRGRRQSYARALLSCRRGGQRSHERRDRGGGGEQARFASLGKGGGDLILGTQQWRERRTVAS